MFQQYHSKWSFLTVLAIVAVVANACVQTSAPAPTPAPPISSAATAKPVDVTGTAPVAAGLKVAALLDGSITDSGWDQLAYQGLQELKDEPGFEVAYTDNVDDPDIQALARGYADDGYNLIIGHGYQFGNAFIEVAPDYPDTWFFATTWQPQPDVPQNIRYIDPAYYPAAYGAGALAALLSKTEAVGFVGGGDNPTQQNIMKSFVYGAEHTVPGVKGLGVVTGDYYDAAKGREAATTMIGNGADVIWHAADTTGLGAIQGAVASKVLALGCYADQTSVAPENLGSSLVMDIGAMVVQLGHELRDGALVGGEWRPTVKEMWHWSYDNGNTDHNSKLIPDDVWQEFLKIWDDIDSGKIDVSVALE